MKDDAAMLRARELVTKAALQHRCWKCSAKPDSSCWNDYADDGITPCDPHDERMMEGAWDVIEALLRVHGY